jgi:glycosyltransferase involved in cell wall biosynthesis
MSDLGGGTGNHVLGMCRQFSPVRCRAEILSLAPCTSRIAPDVPVAILERSPFMHRYPVAQLRALRQIRRFLGDHRFDLVHAYFFWPIIYARLLKLTGRIRHLVENREDEGFNWGFHEYCWLRWTRHVPDQVICVAESVRRQAIDREGLDPDRVRVIHNGIDESARPSRSAADVRRELGFAPEAPLVGMVANLNRAVKGGTYFIESLPHILRKVPQARFVIVGQANQPQFLEQARRLGVDQCLAFAGVRSNVEDFYAALDVSVLTSLSEGLSITILESMQHRLPVVATRVGGNAEVVVDGQTGFLVEPRNPQAVAERVSQLLTDGPLRRRMGESGTHRVQQCFRLQDTADQYHGAYCRLTESHP